MFELNKLYNLDCMEAMKQIPDKHFELAIVDPPYGGANNDNWDNKKRGRFGGRFAPYKIERTGGTWAGKYDKDIKHWDIAPDDEYFEELFRVSENQIIWGGNYFGLPPNRCFIVWRKTDIPESFSMSMCEYAWTSFNENAKIFSHHCNGCGKRFHPTEKPVKLYKWLLHHYAKPGDKILDTHAGSASSLVACEEMGFEYLGFEIDEHYYNLASDRLNKVKAQRKLF